MEVKDLKVTRIDERVRRTATQLQNSGAASLSSLSFLSLQFLLMTGLRHEEKTIRTVADIIQGRSDHSILNCRCRNTVARGVVGMLRRS